MRATLRLLAWWDRVHKCMAHQMDTSDVSHVCTACEGASSMPRDEQGHFCHSGRSLTKRSHRGQSCPGHESDWSRKLGRDGITAVDTVRNREKKFDGASLTAFRSHVLERTRNFLYFSSRRESKKADKYSTNAFFMPLIS